MGYSYPTPLLPFLHLLGKSLLLSSPVSFSSQSARKGFVLFDCRLSKPDLCPGVVLWGARRLEEELPQFKSVTGYGVLIE